ncbi:MAG: hypothetical protein IKP31_06365 [Lachnospiraceae bacterium]|nr:hypothetical protein [Lachnospiraceae bacterium]
MRKLMITISVGIMCIGLTACEGAGLDPTAIQDATRSIEEVTETVNEIETYVDDIQASVQEGIDNTNAAMEWYKTEAWADNPWISTPITEDQVEGIIEAGQKEINSYIGENAVYDVLSDKDIDFFTDYFANESVNGFLLSTYEKPEACNVKPALIRNSSIIEDLSSSEKEKKGISEFAGKISEENIDNMLESVLGISNSKLDKPLKLSGDEEDAWLYIDETAECRKLICNGGFYYNNIYLIMMRDEKEDTPFALTAMIKRDDGSYMIQMNYWSEDMEEVNWDGSFLYDLYDMMQDSDLRNIISIPGVDGNIALGIAAADMEGLGLSGRSIEDAAKLVSDAKDDVKTYMQSYKGYDVYFSNIDKDSVEDFVVSQIDITSGDFKTAEGIGIGTTLDKLKETYGDGIEARLSGGRKQLMYDRGKYNMLFIIGNGGKIEEMTLFLNEVAK